MKWLVALFALGLPATLLADGTTKGKVHTTRRTSGKPISPTRKTSSSRLKNGRASKRVRATPAPSYQLHPDPERYGTIQKALADRGYFKGEVNGQWGDDSTDALKHFQSDHKLDDDGKITALSLIGLGLGPVHDGRSGRDLVISPSTDAPPPPTEEAGEPEDPDHP
jgi:hypothetical protein